MAKIKFVQRKVNFADCGLDIDCNILQAPLCDCGCGNYMDICINNYQELADFMYTMLEEQECNYCAIFALLKDNALMFGSKIYDDMYVIRLQHKNNGLNIDMVKELQDEFEFHCYGLLEENKDGKSYMIVME